MKEKEDEDSSEENDEEKDMALIIKKFKKSFKIKRQGFKKRSMAKGESSKNKDKERGSSPFVMNAGKLGISKSIVQIQRKLTKGQERRL